MVPTETAEPLPESPSAELVEVDVEVELPESGGADTTTVTTSIVVTYEDTWPFVVTKTTESVEMVVRESVGDDKELLEDVGVHWLLEESDQMLELLDESEVDDEDDDDEDDDEDDEEEEESEVELDDGTEAEDELAGSFMLWALKKAER
ncbi:hypothetical protein HK405_015523 [Cladochytrium tenue]|nr:hypothetical protein HK405_015523 [Cladochytrium tenue]